MPELRPARENVRLEIGSQRGRNSHQMGVLGIYDLQGLSYGRTELLVADMRLLAPDPSGGTAPPPAGGRCQLNPFGSGRFLQFARYFALCDSRLVSPREPKDMPDRPRSLHEPLAGDEPV